MKTHYYGEPDGGFINWAFRLKARWPWTRFVWIFPVVLIFALLGPLSWVLVQLGSFGHFLAYKIGIDSHESWE